MMITAKSYTFKPDEVKIKPKSPLTPLSRINMYQAKKTLLHLLSRGTNTLKMTTGIWLQCSNWLINSKNWPEQKV